MITGKELIPSRNLAVALLYLLTRAATVHYPGSTRAHPSPFVKVSQQREGPLPGFAKAILPLNVRENLWRLVAVPVLESGVWEGFGLQGGFRSTQDPHEVLALVQAAVDQAYKDAGFKP